MREQNREIHRAVRADVAEAQVHVEHGRVGQDYPVHAHSFFEAFVFVDGKANHVRGGKSYPLMRGDVFVLGDDMAHGFEHVEDMEIINLMYTPAFFRNTLSEIRRIPGFDACFLVEPEIGRRRSDRPVMRLAGRDLEYAVMMADFIQAHQGMAEMREVIRMHFMALLSFLATRYESQGAGRPATAAVSRALIYMEEHLKEPLRVEQIAEASYFSVRQLERIFREGYGESPMGHLQRMRLQKARGMLREGLGVADVARECGFEDPAYFARVFRRHWGYLPMDVRKNRGAAAEPERQG